jgi:hypothetical protein
MIPFLKIESLLTNFKGHAERYIHSENLHFNATKGCKQTENARGFFNLENTTEYLYLLFKLNKTEFAEYFHSFVELLRYTKAQWN